MVNSPGHGEESRVLEYVDDNLIAPVGNAIFTDFAAFYIKDMFRTFVGKDDNLSLRVRTAGLFRKKFMSFFIYRIFHGVPYLYSCNYRPGSVAMQ